METMQCVGVGSGGVIGFDFAAWTCGLQRCELPEQA